MHTPDELETNSTEISLLETKTIPPSSHRGGIPHVSCATANCFIKDNDVAKLPYSIKLTRHIDGEKHITGRNTDRVLKCSLCRADIIIDDTVSQP
jgi:hypothetical protein